MKLPRVRLWWWMVVVLVAAVGLWTWPRAGFYRRQARYHAAREAQERLTHRVLVLQSSVRPRPLMPPAPPQSGRVGVRVLPSSKLLDSQALITDWTPPPLNLDVPRPPSFSQPLDIQRELAACAARVADHARWRKTFERAAMLPWLPVWPTPW